MAHSRWQQLANICLVSAHVGYVCILPINLYWPMMAISICCQQACIGLIQPIMYLTICTSGPMGGSLCYCQLACNGPQQVATAAEHMSHVGPYDGHLYILPTSLYWPNSTYCICDNIHIWAHWGSLCYCQ